MEKNSVDDQTISSEITMSGENATVLVGRYRIVRQLGQGGMGSVWLAEDTKLDGFKVAIKMLPSVLVNNKRAYAQVKAEALVSLKLSHPNIATVRAFEEESGSPFLVMDYIDGQTLDDYLAEKGKLTEEETVKLLKPVAAALDYAHTQGVVHRDVKPGNIMIRKDGTPFVLDFGIAREIQETMTRVTGKLSSGTLLYMSPEQLNGDAPKPAQDIYSFAAMAYECLTGSPPFVRGGIEDQIKHKTPETLGEHIAICSQVMAGLAKPPELRPANCAAVLEEDGKRVALGDADASASKIRIAVVGALLALAALVGIGGWLWREKLKSGELAAERTRQVEIAAREAARRKVETERIAAEKIETERRAKAEAERIAEEKRKAEEARIAAEKAEAASKTKFEANRVEKCEEGVQLWENGPYWAECNVGATKPEEFGYYFSWGDTVGRKRVGDRWDAVDGSRIGVPFSSENCPTSGKDISQLQLAGYVGSAGSLVAKHDAATAYLGVSWRMPTDAELEALVSNCDNEWATRNGVSGRLVKGRGAYSERRVFFPAAGIGEESTIFFPGSLGGYLSSTPYSEKTSSVCFLSVSSFSFNRGFNSRSNGWSVRPVRRRIEQNGVSEPKTKVVEQEPPSVYVTASINGSLRRATFVSGVNEAGATTPTTVNLKSIAGQKWSCKLKYVADGITYEGEGFCVATPGRQTLDVKLKPAVPLFDRPADMNFCRHCRAPLSTYSKVPRNCPKCGKNLFAQVETLPAKKWATTYTPPAQTKSSDSGVWGQIIGGVLQGIAAGL